MRPKALLWSVLGFRTVPTTVLVVLIYAAVFVTVYVTDQLPAVPKDQKGLDLAEAYRDLQEITRHPHPYNSHANTRVRNYLLSRLSTLASQHPHVHLANDLVSNGSWASRAAGVYFEGTNLLLKIDGTRPELGGVLFSAHYDSVSTASGATDDGMGVVSVLQIAQGLARKRGRRTVVLNVNNGEEDWLNGAHAFLEHPWSNLTSTFLNFEGAASGGRPLLFRATSLTPLLAFRPPNVPHPHANVLSSDAFALGVVRSGTDYSVYTSSGGPRGGSGMAGLDLAFYKGRSMYHTKYDATAWTDGGERSLWAMMEAGWGAGSALVDAPDSGFSSDDGDVPVYFDLFASTLILLSLSALRTTNIVLLVLGPLVLLLLLAIQHIAAREHNRTQQPSNGSAAHSHRSAFAEAWAWFKGGGWVAGFWARARFWVALAVAAGAQVGLVVGYVELNPFIVYSSPYIVLLTTLSLSFLSLSLPLSLPAPIHPNHKNTLLTQLYLLTWVLLLLATISGVGGFYFITVWNASVWAACVLGMGEGVRAVWLRGGGEHVDGRERVVRFEEHQSDHAELTEDYDPETHTSEAEATERTPLIRPSISILGPVHAKYPHEDDTSFWWLAQLLLSFPLPVILVAHVGFLLVGSMAQTLADGSPAIIVYASLSVLSLFLTLPLVPFTRKVHSALAWTLAAVFVLGTVWGWVVFPFDQKAPLKVYFQQQVDLGPLSNSTSPFPSATLNVTTTLTGTLYYLEHLLIPALPSARGNDITCAPESTKPGLHTCSWQSGSGLIPEPGGVDSFTEEKHPRPAPTAGSLHPQTWLRANVTRTSRTSAHISLQGSNTRSCRVYLSNRNITSYNVAGSGSGSGQGTQPGFGIPEEGVGEVRLWSRTWAKPWGVDVQWKDTDEGEGQVVGRVACEWVEYESGMVDNGSGTGVKGDRQRQGRGAKIPALEEVLSFLPGWAVVSKMTDGLVEVSNAFAI